MSRRVGSDKLFKKQKKKNEITKRKEKQRVERVRVLIACEGEKTEPYYFLNLIKDNKLSGSVVIVPHKHTNPSGVLKDLTNHLKTDREFDYKWIVIDRDENGHTLVDFNNAIQNAKKQKVSVAYSNPSFEFWYLIHFNYFTNALHRDDVIKRLRKNYISDYEKKADNIYQLLLPKQKTAIKNAKKLLKYHEETSGINPAKNNPSTTVFELVELLTSFKY